MCCISKTRVIYEEVHSAIGSAADNLKFTMSLWVTINDYRELHNQP